MNTYRHGIATSLAAKRNDQGWSYCTARHAVVMGHVLVVREFNKGTKARKVALMLHRMYKPSRYSIERREEGKTLRYTGV